MKQSISTLMMVRAFFILNPSRSMKLPKSFAKPGDWSLKVLKLSKFVASSAKYSIRDVVKALGVQIDRQVKWKSY